MERPRKKRRLDSSSTWHLGVSHHNPGSRPCSPYPTRSFDPTGCATGMYRSRTNRVYPAAPSSHQLGLSQGQADTHIAQCQNMGVPSIPSYHETHAVVLNGTFSSCCDTTSYTAAPYGSPETADSHLPPPPPPPIEEAKFLQEPRPPPPPSHPPSPSDPPSSPQLPARVPPTSVPGPASRYQGEPMDTTHSSSIHDADSRRLPPIYYNGLPVSGSLAQHIPVATLLQFKDQNDAAQHLLSLSTHVSAQILSMNCTFEKQMYDDVFGHILSFLQIQDLSSSMRVSRTFARIAENARENACYLLVTCTSNHQEYVTSVLRNCKRVKYVRFVQGTTLTMEDIKRILRFYADKLFGVYFGNVRSVCSRSESSKNAESPITCGASLLRFIAETLPNIQQVGLSGCFLESDFMVFAKTMRSLRDLVFYLGRNRFHDGMDMKIFQEGLEILLKRNQSLKSMLLGCFVGSGDILLNSDCPALEELGLGICNISKDMEEKIARKFSHLKTFICSEAPTKKTFHV